jgi:hypothetical protein
VQSSSPCRWRGQGGKGSKLKIENGKLKREKGKGKREKGKGKGKL